MIGCSARVSVQAEGGEQQRAGGEGGERAAIAPAVRCRAHEAVDHRGHAERGRHGSREVEAPGAPLGLGQVARSQQDHGEADRDVDEQAPAPGEPVGQHAAEHEADAATAARDGAVIGDRAGARVPSRNVVVSSASVDGAAIAAPTPCTARAPSSQAADGASPPASDAAVNSAIPITSMRRRPRRSPARAPSSKRPPNVSV